MLSLSFVLFLQLECHRGSALKIWIFQQEFQSSREEIFLLPERQGHSIFAAEFNDANIYFVGVPGFKRISVVSNNHCPIGPSLTVTGQRGLLPTSCRSQTDLLTES